MSSHINKKAVAALGTLTATIALLAAAPYASAQTAPGAGSFPGSFLVPGTNTSLKVGGYVKLDVTYDINSIHANNGGISITGVNLPGTLQHTQSHGFLVSATESRFNLETRTPSAYGEIKTFIEGDFLNPSGVTNAAALRVGTNSFGFRLRLAYATIGPWLIGQQSGITGGGSIGPESLDFTGTLGGGGPTRVPQLRYTYLLPAGQSIAVGIESPEASLVENTGNNTLLTQVAGSQGASKIPTVAWDYRIGQSWGDFHAGSSMQLVTAQNGAGFKKTMFGYSIVAAARIKTFGKDSFLIGANFTDGGSRNTGNSIGEDFEVNFTNGRAKALRTWAGFVGYLHYWTDTLRSSATMSYARANATHDLSGGVAALDTNINASNKWVTWGTANIIWSPVPQVNTGLELVYTSRRTFNPNQNLNFGENYRIQFSTQVKF